ncbi:anti-sigma factor [Galbibacter pacificus]|uniref:Anti-sigma factor n=1 Tax=Galbibacter pacificus TaxID=2996052 RepID=A0ABT6FUW3_9FLAO|nr:anti-sigma factor [Galbibacter pacificus]MDG3583463.1 anti-sigma factor [Galbibacter pacificus]MDG3587060.1 anti-sigma factor [Galbibacter pacificus]
MEIREYIESGILELYVAGVLTEKENEEVTEAIKKHLDLQSEVEEIETAIIKLTAAVAPKDAQKLYNKIKTAVLNQPKVVALPRKRYNWAAYTGWAAAVVLAAGIFYLSNKNSDLEYKLQSSDAKNAVLETKIAEANESLEKAEELVSLLRDKNIQTINLGGQTVSPQSYAKVYWKQEDNVVYIDAQGLPEPPPGKVYQVWSLTLEPLTPTSIGLLDNFTSDDNKVFELKNANQSEAFGITLEPAGGSETPTMEQLYTLGVVGS